MWTATFLLSLFPLWLFFPRSPKRLRVVPESTERILILGASSGIGRALALAYAKRGGRVWVVGRRENELEAVRLECSKLSGDALKYVGDVTNAQDMAKLRDAVNQEWNGVDTVIVSAGVSSLQPLLAVAGVQRTSNRLEPICPSAENVEHIKSVTAAAMATNFYGPLVSAITFIPLLTATSQSPSMVLISSVAAVIPPPTRSIYSSTKSASLSLFQALAVEHPEIVFSLVLPSTVTGSFRASAVDGGPIREDTRGALTPREVAARTISSVDRGEQLVWIPRYFKWIHIVYHVFPRLIIWGAKRKYQFQV